MSDSGMHTHASVDRELGVTSLDGSHSHEFRLPNGTTVKTSEDGGHAHAVVGRDGGAGFAEGGVHAHTVIVDGAELRTEVDGWHMHEVGEKTIAAGGMHSHALVLPTGETVLSTYTDTSKGKNDKPRKKGAERKRDAPTAERLEAVESSALAMLKALKKPTEKKPARMKPKGNKKPARKSRIDLDADDLSPPRGSIAPKYDPITRKFIR